MKQENYTPWYAKINPEMTVPALKYNAEIILDSRNICLELCKRHPEANLLPADREQEILAFIDMVYDQYPYLGAFTFRLFSERSFFLKLFVIRKKIIGTLWNLWWLGRNPEFKELVAKRWAAIRNFSSQMKSDITEIKGKMGEILRVLDQNLATSKFAVGQSFTLADVMATVLLARIKQCSGLELMSPRV